MKTKNHYRNKSIDFCLSFNKQIEKPKNKKGSESEIIFFLVVNCKCCLNQNFLRCYKHVFLFLLVYFPGLFCLPPQYAQLKGADAIS